MGVKTTKKEESIVNTTDVGRIAKTNAEKVKALQPKMYVGPTVSGIGIQNRVYTEIPEEAKEKAKEIQEINHLFIPVKNYPVANKMLREKKGYIYSAFCKVSALRNGGGES